MTPLYNHRVLWAAGLAGPGSGARGGSPRSPVTGPARLSPGGLGRHQTPQLQHGPDTKNKYHNLFGCFLLR